MQRRSFFGVVFGGLLSTWLPRPRWRHFRSPIATFRQYWPDDPKYRFGFTGFEPAQGTLEGQDGGTVDTYQGITRSPRDYVSYPMDGGFYKPGDIFKIGRRRITKVD